MDDFILDWEDFAQEVVAEIRFGSDARDKWLCLTFPHCFPPELKADLHDAIREKRICTEEQCLHCLVRIMLLDEQHPGFMEYFLLNLGASERMLSLKNSVYVEVFSQTAGGRLLRLNNVEWGRGEKLKLQMIPARMGLDSIIEYVSVSLKLNSKNEAYIKDRHNHGNHDRRENRHHREVQDDPGGSSEDG